MTFPALDQLPAPPSGTVTVHVGRGAAKPLRQGHPWLFDGGIERVNKEAPAGTVAVVFDDKRKMVGLGLCDPEHPIRVKMLMRRGGVPIDEEFFAQRVDAALAKRAHLKADQTDGYRLIYGESDGLPGLVVDRYAKTLVIKLYSAIWWSRLSQVLPSLMRLTKAHHVVLRLSRALKDQGAAFGLSDGQLLSAKALPEDMTFLENGLRFEVDVLRGQKTGFFLDQRDNRKRVENLSKGKTVLNVFSYTGGFSLYAARGGATEVTSLDASRPALAAAQRNFALNPQITCPHKVLCGDAFAEMKALIDAEKTYDVVVIDPPSFARKKSEVESAGNAYGRLAKLGLALLARGGTLVLASCSSRISMDDFVAINQRAASQVSKSLKILERHEHAIDHPVDFAEGAYLKCLFTTA